jgi:hypothetical protein
VYCAPGERKHEIADEHLSSTQGKPGLFLVLVSKAPALVWEAQMTGTGKLGQLVPKEPWPYVNHYSFHILDPDWGHVTIKMSGHPPFGAQVILNGHEYVAAQAQKAGVGFTKQWTGTSPSSTRPSMRLAHRSAFGAEYGSSSERGTPPALAAPESEREADAGDEGSRLQEMRAAEGPQKVIQYDLVGQNGDLERPTELFVPLGVEQIVAADTQIEDVARGFTRSGLWASFSWPACGRVISFDVTVPLHEVMGLLYVASTLPQARPIEVCRAAVRARAAAESGTPLTTRPLS